MLLKMKKTLSIILTLSILTLSISFTVFAAEDEHIVNVFDAESVEAVAENIEKLGATELICISDDDFSEVQANILTEVIDNGTDVLFLNTDTKSIAEAFDCSYSVSDDGIYIGCYLQTIGGAYSLTPIYASAMQDENESISDNDTELSKLSEALNNRTVDITDVFEELSQIPSDSEFIGQISDYELASLQASTSIGNSFKDASIFKYFYKEGSVNGIGTTYKYNSSEGINGWSKLGSIRILGYAIKVKTVGTKTYDNVYSIVTASGLNNKYVKYYTYNMKVTSANTSILDETWLDGGTNKTITTSIANGISSDGKSTITSTTSYSYNPNGQNITNSLGAAYVKTWTASPASNVKNGSWKIQPSITVLNSKGTTSNTTVKLYVNNFRISGGVRNYTITSEASTSLTFKNHK